MGGLLARVLPLALGAAVSPTVLAVNLLVLGSPTKPRSRGAFFALGGFSVIGVLTVVALVGLLPTTASSNTGANTTGAVIDLVCAALLTLLGVRALLKRPSEAPARKPTEGPWFEYLGLGAIVMATNFTTMVLYIPAMKEISHSNAPTGDQAVAVVLVFLVTTLTVWFPLLFTVAAPSAADRVLGAVNRFVTDHQRMVTAVVCLGFAALLAVKGIGKI